MLRCKGKRAKGAHVCRGVSLLEAIFRQGEIKTAYK